MQLVGSERRGILRMKPCDPVDLTMDRVGTLSNGYDEETLH